jgi:toxin FitB
LEWLNAADENEVYISVITLGEIRKGCALLEPGKQRTRLEHWLDHEMRDWFEDRILSVDDAIAERWGELEAARQRKESR